jgi:hypothetical protein
MELSDSVEDFPSQSLDFRIITIALFLKNYTGIGDRQCCYIRSRCSYVFRTKQGRKTRAL